MVTIHSGSNFNKYDFEGNSTDPKPTEGVKTNQKFLELDTLDIYYFDDDGTWKKAGYNRS